MRSKGSVRRLFLLSLLATSALAACSSDSTTDSFAPLALTLSLSPAVDTIFVSDSVAVDNPTTLTLAATSLGRAVQTPSGVEWTSSDPGVASVTSAGKMVPVAIGTTTVTARVNSSKATATVVVAYKARRVLVSPATLVGLALDTVTLTVSALDADSVLVPGLRYAFTSADPSLATVTRTGNRTARVVFVKAGAALVNVTTAGQTVTVTGGIQPREFISVPATGAPAGALTLDAGDDVTCGLLPLGRAYCFGKGSVIGVAKDTVCFNDDGTGSPCTVVPRRIAPQLNLLSISVGGSVACAAAADNHVYCWGSQEFGQLGNGKAAPGTPTAPAQVVAARSPVAEPLLRVSAGGDHVCGLSAAGKAFCWGRDDLFQLGNGDGVSLSSSTPVAVAGTNVFATISAGQNHTCGVTATGTALCWGDNSSGQLGAGSDNIVSDVPLAIGGNSFASISAGASHTCGLTAAGVALCWGDNSFGQLGADNPNVFQSNAPVTVAGGRLFKSISAGTTSTCGITTAGAAYCWGDNTYWQLGASNVSSSESPVAVGGGHTDFTAVTVGTRHACATSSGGAFCWGSNIMGALGNELQAARQATPTKTVTP